MRLFRSTGIGSVSVSIYLKSASRITDRRTLHDVDNLKLFERDNNNSLCITDWSWHHLSLGEMSATPLIEIQIIVMKHGYGNVGKYYG